MDLAADQHSECALVDGRGADSRTLRIYNDELGGSFINQTIDVRPWRWYVAEVWVKSDGMYSPDVRVSLQEGRRRGQWQYVMDYFDKPPPGWRVVRAYDHSGDSERLTLTIGGPAFSGELLISEPVVRECSLDEAVSYHAKPNARQPGVYGPPVDAAQGLPGYAIQLWNVASGKRVRTLRGHKGLVKCVTFVSDGRLLASGGSDMTIRLWETDTGKQRTTVVGHSNTVYCVAFAPAGDKLASASFDRTIKLWDLEKS